MYKTHLIIFVITLLILVIYLKQNLNINIMTFVYLTLLRGIVYQSRFWWDVCDILGVNKSGIELFNMIENRTRNSFYRIQVGNKDINIVMDLENVRAILDGSPHVFGVGELKYNYFNSFMDKNVGVSNMPEWTGRRKMNEEVLMTNQIHSVLNNLIKYTKTVVLSNPLPTKPEHFREMSRLITSYTVFGEKADLPDSFFHIFKEANSLSIIDGPVKVCPYAKAAFLNVMNQNMNRCTEGHKSLTERAAMLGYNDREELVNQVPHWIFPIFGIVNTFLPKLLCLLCNNPESFARVAEEVKRVYDDKEIYASAVNCHTPYMRHCILEAFRLNNPVIALSRTLLEDGYKFSNYHQKFKQGDQFLILTAGFLRNNKYFFSPNQFIPDRWKDDCLENKYSSLMWSQGPQKCPGKELSIMITKILLIFIIIKLEFNISKISCNYKLDNNNIDIINHFRLMFEHYE